MLEPVRGLPVRYVRGASVLAACLGALVSVAGDAAAQSTAQSATPRRGGELRFAVVAEPPSTDCHAVNTFAMVHPVAPQYSTLLKYVGSHDNLKMAGDLAESWTAAPDGMSYTFKLRKDVSFHDGSPFTSADIKATYERIIRPPPGVVSQRKAVHADIGAIETPDDHTVIFRMKRVSASIILHFASPFNCVYSARRLAADPQYPSKEVMGTGAFKFVEHVKGSHWKAKRNEAYFLKDRPYLDGYTAYFMKTPNVVPALQGGQIDAEFRGRTPKERDRLVEVMKDQARVMEGPWLTNIQFPINTQRKPFDDVRVRQALTHAIDRWGGSENLGKISLIKGVNFVFRPGSPYSLPQDELKKLPGFWPDANKARDEARRLLKEAGVPNLKLKLLNRQIGEPFIPAGLYAIDQWKRVGVEAEHVVLETKLYFEQLYKGDFDIGVNNVSDFIDDPSAQFNTLLSVAKSGQFAYSRHTDRSVDEAYDRQAGTVDPVARLKLVNDLERYLGEKSYSISLLWYQRIVVNHRRVMGWELQPSHFSGQSLVDVWLAE